MAVVKGSATRPAAAEKPREELAVPAFPAIASAILRLCAREDVTLEEIAEVVAADAAIASEILRVSNSASLGVRGEVRSITQASTLLGLKRLSGIAASVAVRNSLGALWKKPAVRQCWQHNLACAITSEHMARSLQREPQVAYTFGLLHDIGRLGMFMRYQDAYVTHVATPPIDGCSPLVAEREAFGTDHGELGRAMVTQLGLSEALCDAAARHHEPPSGEIGFTEFAHVACELTTAMGFGVRANRAKPNGNEPAPPPDFSAALACLPAPAKATVTGRLDELVELVTTMVDAYDKALG